MSVSKVTIIGRLGRDPETRYTPSGAMNVQFTLATSRRYTDRDGQQQENTTWWRVTGWGRLAETMDKLTQSGALTKGRQVYVEGRLEAREYTGQDGQQRTSLDVNASEFQLLGSRAEHEAGGGGNHGGDNSGGGGGGQRNGGGRQQQQGSEADYGDMDDVPF